MNTIYALVDEKHQPRYIGKTARLLSRRLADHISRAPKGKTHKNNWINSMLSQGLIPTIVAIETCDDNWSEREIYWIAEGRRIGWRLTNGNDGGQGGDNPSLETREKISKAHKGKPKPLGMKQKLSKQRKGKPLAEDHKAAIRASCSKGFQHTAETIEKIRIAKMGNTATLGRKATAEQCANVKKAVNNWMSQRIAIRDDKGRLIRWDKK